MLLALYLPWATGKRQAAYRCIRINSLLARAQRAFLRNRGGYERRKRIRKSI